MLMALLSIPQVARDYFITEELLDLYRMVNFFHNHEDMPSYHTGHTAVAMIYLV